MPVSNKLNGYPYEPRAASEPCCVVFGDGVSLGGAQCLNFLYQTLGCIMQQLGLQLFRMKELACDFPSFWRTYSLAHHT